MMEASKGEDDERKTIEIGAGVSYYHLHKVSYYIEYTIYLLANGLKLVLLIFIPRAIDIRCSAQMKLLVEDNDVKLQLAALKEEEGKESEGKEEDTTVAQLVCDHLVDTTSLHIADMNSLADAFSTVSGAHLGIEAYSAYPWHSKLNVNDGSFVSTLRHKCVILASARIAARVNYTQNIFNLQLIRLFNI